MLAIEFVYMTTFLTRLTSLIVATVSIVSLYRTIILRRRLGVTIPWAMTIFTIFWLLVISVATFSAMLISPKPIAGGLYITVLGAGYTWSIAGMAWHILYFVKHASEKMLIPITKLADTLVTIEKEARGKT